MDLVVRDDEDQKDEGDVLVYESESDGSDIYEDAVEEP